MVDLKGTLMEISIGIHKVQRAVASKDKMMPRRNHLDQLSQSYGTLSIQKLEYSTAHPERKLPIPLRKQDMVGNLDWEERAVQPQTVMLRSRVKPMDWRMEMVKWTVLRLL